MTSVTGGLEGRSRFPKLEDCAHFHYDHVELGPIQLSLYEEEDLKPLSSLESNNENCENKFLTVKVNSGGQSWLLRRTYDNFRMLDKQLHRCIYDRKFSALPELPHPIDNLQEKTDPEAYIRRLLIRYLERLSHIAGSLINCGPVLSWLELDNRGRRLLVTGADNCLINTPAVAAAYAIKRYSAIAADEISFDVGDMISVIDMPPPEESSWWRGKKGFLVGFFPFHCVAVITDKVPRTLNLHQVMSCTEPSKPVLRKHGKLIAFFRAFILARPSRRRLKQTGILRERVFGCDLGEHLLNSGHDIPMVLKCCADFIEKYGLVDGIYRLSGVTSNIQKLRTTFDEDRVPKLYEDEAILQDIHSVASLLKMYFRELPNPLCTYQLYHGFVLSVQQEDDNQRLAKMRETVQKLPPPHYRTLEYLMHHLARVAERGESTGMTARNVAIVWAPNLLRCKELELGGVAALQVVGVQAVVTEFLIRWQHLIFTSNIHHLPPSHAGTPKKSRPKSLAVSTPTRLLSLEEAQSRVLLGKPDQDYIEVGGGPSCLPKEYHTIIELPSRKRGGSKRSPLGWKSLFSRGSSSVTNSSRKSRSPATCKSTDKRKTSIPSDIKFGHSINETESQLLEVKTNLRPVKSAESLTSGSAHNSARNSSCLETPIIRQLTTSPPSQPGHNRSSSHDSYFDHLAESTPEKTRTSPVTELDDEGLSLSLDLSELQVNFELEESEMRIFSEDETNQLFTSPSNCEQVQTLKRQPMLALTEDSLSSDPSPKKHKTDNDNKGDLVTNNLSKRCRLEERLSSGELQYIDSQSPEQILAHVDIHSHIGCEESQRSPSLAEATLSENESMTLSMTSGTPRLNYTPLTEDSLSDGNILTPEYSLLKFSASSFHSPSSLEANSPADSPFSSNKNVRHSYQDSSNLQSEALLPCSRLSFPGFLTSPISHAANNSLPNHQYELLENEKESSIAEDSKNVSVTSNSESGLLNDSDSSSNDVSGINLNLSDNIYENVECGDKKLSPTIAVYENMSISNDDNIKYEPIDNCESESCYEDVFIGSNFLVNDSLRKVPVSNQNENEENVGLIQEEVSSMNDSSSSNSSPDCKSQSMLGANRIYDNLQEETTYENVPDSKQLYQQVKYFKRSVTEINELIDSQPSSLIQVNNSSNKSMDVDIVSDDIAQSHKNLAASSRSIDAKTESPSMTTENVTAKRLHSPVKQSNKVGVTGETQNVTGSLNTNNEPCTAPSRLTLDNKKPTVSSNIENDSSHERNSEQQTETGISNLDSTKSVHQLLSCFECSSDEFSRRKFRGKDGSDKMSLSADSLKSLPGDSPEKKKATSEASRIPILEKVPENESDLDRRKRIEKYKEERRNYLRQKFSMENLKNSANEESDVLRRYKQKADSNKEENSFSDKSNIKSDKDLIKNKLNESQKCSLDTSSKTTVENAHSRSSVLDKCLNLELKKSPPAQISSSKTNFKKPLYTRSASDNSGLLSPSRTMISICYSPTRKNVSQEEEGKTSLPPMVLQDEIISVKDSKTTCVTIKHKDGDEEKSCAVLSNAPKSAKSNIGAEYSSRERNTTNFTSSPEKRGSKEKLVSPDKQSLVSQRVIQLTGPSDGNTQSATRKTSLSHQKQPPAGTNRQRAHSTSERMTPYCIKDMAALFEKPEELSKKS